MAPLTRPAPISLPKLISEHDLAETLGISKRHLGNLRTRRVLPYVMLGKSVRYDPAAVRQVLDRLTVAPVVPVS